MDANARIDYFRSELLGQLAQVRKEATEHETRTAARIRELEAKIEVITGQVHNVALSR